MAASLRAENFNPLNIKDVKILDVATEVGDDHITLQNTLNLSGGDFMYVGYPVNEATEKQQVVSLSGLTASLSSVLISPHQRFEGCLQVFGDKIRFYRAANINGTVPDDVAFSLQATVDITTDKYYTDWVDSSGSSEYWYKFTYYNSNVTSETRLEDSVAVRGGDYGHYATIDSIRSEAGIMDVPQITDAMIDLDRIAAESEINATLNNNYSLPLPEPYPGIIVKLTSLLAAGYVLSQQYSVLSTDMSKQGEDKLKQARSILLRIGDRSLGLTDLLGNSLLLPLGPSGWPNDTTASATEEDSGGGTMFRISHRF